MSGSRLQLETNILGQMDIADLTNRGLLKPPSIGGCGMRKLHKRRAYRPSDEENYEIPLKIKSYDDAATKGEEESEANLGKAWPSHRKVYGRRNCTF